MPLRARYPKLTAWLLIAAMCAPLWYAGSFYLNRLEHRLYMWQAAHHRQTIQLQLDSASIQWVKKGREFILNGEYVDVVRLEYRQGTAFIDGVYDHEETEMHRELSRRLEGSSGGGHSTARIMAWLLTPLAIVQPQELVLIAWPLKTAATCETAFKLPSPFLLVSAQPPDTALS